MSAGEIMMSTSNKAANIGELICSQKSMTSTDMQRHRFLVPIKALDELFPGFGKQKPPLIFKQEYSSAATTFEGAFETKHEQGHLYLKGNLWKNFERENNITVGGVVKFTKDPNVENQILVSYISPDPSAEALVGSGGGVSRESGDILAQNQMASKHSSDLYMAPSNNAVVIESRSIGVVTESIRADHHDYHDSLEHPSLVYSLHSQGKVAGYGYDDGADKNATNNAIDYYFSEDGVRLNPNVRRCNTLAAPPPNVVQPDSSLTAHGLEGYRTASFNNHLGKELAGEGSHCNNSYTPLLPFSPTDHDNFDVVHQHSSPSPNALEQYLPSSQTPKGSISDNAHMLSTKPVRVSVVDNLSAIDEDRERLLPYYKQYIAKDPELPAKLECLDSSSRDNVVLLVGSIMEILSLTRVEDITPQQRSEINKCWCKILKYTNNLLELPKLAQLVASSQKLTKYETTIKELDHWESTKRKASQEIDKCKDSLKHFRKDEIWIDTLGG